MGVITIKGAGKFEVEKPLDDGKYTLECVAMGMSERGNGSLQISFVVTDGPEQVSEQEIIGRKLTDFVTVDPEVYSKHKDGGKFAIQRIASLFAAFGVEPTDDLDTDEFVGKTVEVKVKTSPDNDGILRERVVHYYPAE